MRSKQIALIVDDEPSVARALELSLRTILPDEWEIIAFTTAEPALAEIVSNEQVRLAIVDIFLPTIGGVSLIRAALSRRPDLHGRVIVCSSGHVDETTARELFDEYGCLPLSKPFTAQRLRELVEWIIAPDSPPAPP